MDWSRWGVKASFLVAGLFVLMLSQRAAADQFIITNEENLPDWAGMDPYLAESILDGATLFYDYIGVDPETLPDHAEIVGKAEAGERPYLEEGQRVMSRLQVNEDGDRPCHVVGWFSSYYNGEGPSTNLPNDQRISDQCAGKSHEGFFAFVTGMTDNMESNEFFRGLMICANSSLKRIKGIEVSTLIKPERTGQEAWVPGTEFGDKPRKRFVRPRCSAWVDSRPTVCARGYVPVGLHLAYHRRNNNEDRPASLTLVRLQCNKVVNVDELLPGEPARRPLPPKTRPDTTMTRPTGE